MSLLLPDESSLHNSTKVVITINLDICLKDAVSDSYFHMLQAAFCSETVNDLLDALLKAKLSTENNNSNISHDVGLTEDHILMTVGDIFGAGVETTSTVLKWAIAYLLHYPEVGELCVDIFGCENWYNCNYALITNNVFIHMFTGIT